MDFFLFCLLNAVLFIRPAEIVPSLLDLPIYQCIIILNLIVSLPFIARQLEPSELRANPITLCVLGLLLAVPLSHIRHFDFWHARYDFLEFSKLVLYYLLFVGVIRNEQRLNRFFLVLLLLLASMTTLSLLHNQGVINVPALDSLDQFGIDPQTGQVIVTERLRSTGIFNDPNDFAMILVAGLVLGWHYLTTANLLTKPLWLLAMGGFGFALTLTKSRGGFLALFVAAGVYAQAKWGWKRAVLVACLMLPLVAAIFAMRNDGGLDSGTGQSRVQIWAEGFSLWRHTPMFGIGYGMYGEEVGHVAHNSFLQCYVELGLLGGTMFFGCFYFALRTLWEQRNQPEVAEDIVARRRTTLVLALVAGAAASMLSLSRSYGVPAYMFLGLAATSIQFNGLQAPFTLPQFEYATSRKLAIASAAFVIATFIFMKTIVRWS